MEIKMSIYYKFWKPRDFKNINLSIPNCLTCITISKLDIIDLIYGPSTSKRLFRVDVCSYISFINIRRTSLQFLKKRIKKEIMLDNVTFLFAFFKLYNTIKQITC